MKQKLLISAAMSLVFESALQGATAAVEEPYSEAAVAGAGSVEPYMLHQNLERAIEFAGLRVMAEDAVEDVTLGGTYVHLRNSVFQSFNTLSLVALRQDDEGRAMVMDDAVALRSRSIHLVSALDGAALSLQGLLETVDGDLVIEARGDVMLPAIAVQGNMSIVTTGRIIFQQAALVSGHCTLLGQSIVTEAPVSLLGEGHWTAEEDVRLTADLTSEVGVTLNAQQQIVISGRLGAENLVLHAPAIQTTETSQVTVRRDVAVTARDVTFSGELAVNTSHFEAGHLVLDGHVNINELNVEAVHSIITQPSADVTIARWIDRPIPPEDAPAPTETPEFLLENNGRLRVRRSMDLTRTFHQRGDAVFEGGLDIAAHVVNEGALECAGGIALLPKQSTLINRGTIRTSRMLAEPAGGILAFKNTGAIELQNDSTITATSIVLEGDILTNGDLKLYGLGETIRQNSGNLTVRRTLQLTGQSVLLGGSLNVGADLDARITRRLAFAGTENTFSIGRDFIFRGREDMFCMLSHSAPIRIGRNLIVDVPAYYMLSDLEAMGRVDGGYRCLSLADIETANLVQRGKLVVAGNVALSVKRTADVDGLIKADGISEVGIEGTLRGDLSIEAFESRLKAGEADARIHVTAECSTATFGRLANREDAYKVEGGTEHSIHVESGTSAGVGYSGTGNMRLVVDGEYKGALGVATTGLFEVTHTGTGRLDGIKAGKAIVHAKSYPVHDFDSIDAVHVCLDLADDVDLRRDIHIASNRLLELTANNLGNHANIRGNFVAHTKRDLVNHGLIKGETVVLKVGGTFFEGTGTVHGTRKEVIDAGHFKLTRSAVMEQYEETRTDFRLGCTGSKATVQRRTIVRDSGAYECREVTDRHDVTWVARDGDLDVRSMGFNLTGHLHLEATQGVVRADAQRYETGGGHDRYIFEDVVGEDTRERIIDIERDRVPHYSRTSIRAGGGASIIAGRRIEADGIDADVKGALHVEAEEVRMRTLAESYVSRRWSRSTGFLGWGRESGVDYDVAVAQPALRASGGVVIKGGRFENTGVVLDGGAGNATIHMRESVHLDAATVDVPFEQARSTWWGAGETRVRGHEEMSLVFSAQSQAKVRIISEHGTLTGEALMIEAKQGQELFGPKGVSFTTEAPSAIVIDDESQSGWQFRLFGADFSLAPERLSEESLRPSAKAVRDNPTVRRVAEGWRETTLDQSGVHAAALEASPVNLLSFGIGYRSGHYASEVRQGHGARILGGGHLYIGTEGGAPVDIVADRVDASATTFDTPSVTWRGTTTRSFRSEMEKGWTFNARTLGVGADLAGEALEETRLRHTEGQASLGDTHFVRDQTQMTTVGATVGMGTTSGGIVDLHGGHAVDQHTSMRGRGYGGLGLDLGLILCDHVAVQGTAEGSLVEQADSSVHVEHPHAGIREHSATPLVPLHDRSFVSAQLSAFGIAMQYVFGSGKDDLMRLLKCFNELTPDQKLTLRRAHNPVDTFLEYAAPHLRLRTQLPENVRCKLLDALNFAAAVEDEDPKERPKIPDSFYMETFGGRRGDGDLATLLHDNETFRYQAALLSELAYNNHRGQFQSGVTETTGDERVDLSEVASALERSSIRWELDRPFMFRDISGGITATYTSDFGSVKVVAFMGTNHWSEWSGYTLESANQLIPASTIDPLIVEGHVNTNFVANYQMSGWSLPVRVDTHYVFTGHSRGGAVADIAALHLGVRFSCFDRIGALTFGQPAVFSQGLAEWVDRQMESRNVKVVIEGDFIPHILGWEAQPVRGSADVLSVPFRSAGIVQTYPRQGGVFNHNITHYLNALQGCAL